MKRSKSIVVFLGLVLAVCVMAALFSDRLLAPLARRIIVKLVATELGMEIKVEKISGTYFRDLKFGGVQTLKPSATGMLVAIGADSVVARYSLLQLRHGADAFLGSLRLELDGARVVLDFSRADDEEGTGAQQDSPASALVLPVTRARNSRVDLRGRDWALTLAGLELTVEPFDQRQGGIPLTVHAAESVIELPFMRRQTPELGARGLLTRDSVRVDGLEVNGRPAVEAARFDYAPGQPVLGELAFTAFGGRGRIEAIFAEDSTTLDWQIREVEGAAVAALSSLEEPLPAGRVTSSGRLSGAFSDPVSLTGAISLKVADGSFRHIPFERLALAGSSADGLLLIDSLEAEMGSNSLVAGEVALPLTALVAGNLEELARETRGRFSVRLEDIPALLTQAGMVLPRTLPAGEIPAHRLVLAGRAAEGGVTLESGSFSSVDGGQVTLERFAITWPTSGPLLTGLNLAARLTAVIPDLGRSAAIFGVEAVGGELQAEVSCAGPWRKIQGTIALQGRNLHYRAIEVDRLLLDARTGPEGWRLVNLEAVRGEDRLAGSGGFVMTPLSFEELVLDLTLLDFHPYLGWFLAGEVPAAHGALVGHLELSGSPGAPEGSFKAVLSEADFAGVAVARGELLGRLAGEKVEIANLRVRAPEGEVELAGSFRHRAWGVPVSGSIERLILTREELSLQLLTPVAIRLAGADSWSFEEATLRGEAGTFRLVGGASPPTGVALSFQFTEVTSVLPAAFFPELPVEFSGLKLAGTVSGRLPAPEVALQGSVAELRTVETGVVLAGQLDLLLSARGLVLKTFSWTTPAGEQFTLTGSIPYDPYARRFLPAALEVDGNFSIPDLGILTAFLPEAYRLPGRLQGSLRLAGSGEHPEAVIDLHAREVGFPDSLPVHPPGLVAVDAVAVLRDNDLHLETLTVTGADLNLSLTGNWRRAGDLLQRRAADELPGSLDLRGSFAVADIGWLARGIPAIRRLGGAVEGTLALSGPAAQPELVAELRLADGEFRAESTMPPLRDLQVRVSLAQRTATITRFTGSIGGAPFTVTGSVGWPLDGEPEADLRIQGANVLLYRSEAVGVRGDADLTVRGPFTAPAFAGTLAITDGRLRKNINWLEPLRGLGRSKAPVAGSAGPGGLGLSFPNPPLRDATFDIRVTSRNPFQVKSNVARGNLRPDLRLRGTGEIPLLTGVIYIDRSRILLPAGRLAVEAGLIRFPENSPNQPLLEISGSSRILGYDINLTVEGSFDEPTINLSSVPPLPQDALLLLLLTGRLPPGEVEQQRGWQEGVKVALYVGKGVLEEWFGGNDLDSDESLLDRFDVVVGRGISRQGNETIGAQYRLADSVLREGDELYLVAERDIYDEFNTGLRIVLRFK